jgi:hypothetical protein
MRRRLLLTAFGLIVLMALGATAGWWLFLATYGQRFAASATAEGSEPRLKYAAIERFGFPFTVGIRLRDAEMTGQWGAGQAKLRAPVAEISARPWRPRDMDIRLPEGLGWTTTAATPANRQSGQAAQAEGKAGPNLPAAAGAESAPLWAVELDLESIQHTLTYAGTGPLLAERGRVVWRKLNAISPETSEIEIGFGDMTFPPGSLFGPKAKQADATLAITGAFPFSGKPEAIKAWREADGRVDILRSRVRWGALDAMASGAIGLDTTYRPAGGVTLRIAKGDAVIDRLTALGQLNATAAAAAKTMLAFASLSAKDGRAAAPITLADGEAAIAGFTLGPVHPVCACE